jgi:predicted peptidase
MYHNSKINYLKYHQMKKFLHFIIFTFILNSIVHAQQIVIQLYQGVAPGSENWTWSEAENDNNEWQTKVVYNVSRPTLTVFKPEEGKANGTSVIICPGGAFRALSINSEGYDVAKWLVKKGVTCFVLKYRLIQSKTTDPVAEMMAIWGSKQFEDENRAVIPLQIADARTAIAYVRNHASEMKLDPNRIGIMGFSAGGTLTASSAYNYNNENKPNFVAPVYPFYPKEMQGTLANDAPPAFIVAASDDNLGLAPHSVDLYNQWLVNKHNAELHMYSKGGHGFGMRVQNVPSDKWIERFGDWLNTNGWLAKSNYDAALNVYEKKEFVFAEGKVLLYRILYPENYDRTKKYPIILFLHGSGERGTDNELQLVHGAKLFIKDENRKNYPAIVIIPQCPLESSWASIKADRTKQPVKFEFDYTAEPNWPLVAANELVKKIIKEEAVDAKRTYISGLSMGGMGTFESVYRYPGLYTAALPICGGGNTTLYDQRVKKTSFWVFHGAADAVVDVKLSREMVEKLKSLKADVTYSEYPGVHHNSWDNAFAEPDYLKWMFQKRKNK